MSDSEYAATGGHGETRTVDALSPSSGLRIVCADWRVDRNAAPCAGALRLCSCVLLSSLSLSRNPLPYTAGGSRNGICYVGIMGRFE